MTAVPLLGNNPAGIVAKTISDFLYLDTKNAEFVYEALMGLYGQGYGDGHEDAEHDHRMSMREDADD